jgi:hypothetical protein
MKTTILLLLCSLSALNGCGRLEETKFEKPFVITFKYIESGNCNRDGCRYRYQDKNGRVEYFCEEASKYNVGDTIK